MDKLQPIIRNRFWILAGLVLPLAMYGYYSANGSLKAATATRIGDLDKVKSGVSSGNEPNDDYAKKLAHINGYYDVAVNQAIVDIWNHQRQRMTWPTSVAPKVPAEFQGEFDLNTRFTYKGLYNQLIEELRRRVEPVAPMTMTLAKTVTWKEKVMLAVDVPQAKFGSLGITSKEMWDAQIDIWLTRLLLDAVVKTNEDKDSITESIVRRIDALDLLGGDGQPVLSGGSGGGGGGSDMGGDMMMMSPGTGGGGRAGGVTSSVGFNPAQEFGAGGGAPSGGGGGGGENMDMMEMMSSGSSDSAESTVMRYIAESETAPFLERGFYMSVIIMQKKVPDFIVELVNSEWPIRVTRFHIGANPHRVEQRLNTRGFGGRGETFGPESGMEMEMTEAMESGGFGGRGGGRGPGSAGKSAYSTGLPEFATAAMNHPDLVQLDLCGVITMYREPKGAIEALAASKLKAEPSVEPVSAETATEADPTAVPQPAPAEGETPTEGTTPPAEGAAAETPTPAGDTPAPANPGTSGASPPPQDANPPASETTTPPASETTTPPAADPTGS